MRIVKNDWCSTWWAKIFLSGPIEVVKQVCREECFDQGLCVTVEPTHFIYKGGEEFGCVVGLINYPRFKTPNEIVTSQAKELAKVLLDRTFQHSVLVMTPETTYWYSKRNE